MKPVLGAPLAALPAAPSFPTVILILACAALTLIGVFTGGCDSVFTTESPFTPGKQVDSTGLGAQYDRAVAKANADGTLTEAQRAEALRLIDDARDDAQADIDAKRERAAEDKIGRAHV